jgi:tetratricopeptide (TPR) repeat protein
LDPRFAPPVNNLAVRTLNRGQKKEALEGFQKYVERQPADAVGWVNLGNAWIEIMRDEAKASVQDKSWARKEEEAYDRALGLDGGLASVYRGQGALWELNGDKQRAVASYRVALPLDPKQEDIKRRIEALNPDDKTSRVSAAADLKLAFGLRSGPKLANLQKDLDRATVAARYSEARSLRDAGDLAKAIEMRDWALDMDSGNALGWLMKADLCLRAGRQAEVAKALDEAAGIRPEVKAMRLYRDIEAKLVRPGK